MQEVIQEQEYSTRFDLALWRRILVYMKPHRRKLLPFLVLASTIALAEASFNLLTRAVIDVAARDGVSVRLWPYAALYAALLALVGLCIWSFIHLGGRISNSIVHEIRRRGFERLQQLEFSYYDKRPVGWLMARMTSDCERLGNIMTWGMLDLVWGCSLTGGVAVIMLWLNWKLALLVLVVIPPMALIALHFQRVILASSRTVRKQNSRITAGYNEAIMGVETSKTLVREEANLAEFTGLAGEMRAAATRNAVQSALLFPFIITLGAVGSSLAMWAGGNSVLAGTISLGTLVAFVAYSREFFVPISEMSRIFAELQIAQAAAERILGLIDTEPVIRDNQAVRARLQHDPVGAPAGSALDTQRGIRHIEFRDVEFAYVPGQPVLRRFNLSVRAGERIALVGPTGGGKSTIVALLCRFYEPTGGQILLDGVDYRECGLAWLQSQLGIVLQTPHLFSGTLRENIRYGRLDATDAEVETAARLVGAEPFIREMELGYEARIGQGGVNLSTGQRQLISFARAVLADPRIFVMDEATSSVDTPTEQLIQQGLEAVLHDRTSFIIAHRLSTIRTADRILVIRGGEIEELGTHHELLALRGHYYRLYTEQFTEEEEQRLLRG